jgi:uncharacterized membrane protein
LGVAIRGAADGIEWAGSCVLGLYLLRSLGECVTHWRAPEVARVIAGSWIIFALDLKLGATLLKLLVLTGWEQLGVFALILAIRLVVKRQIVWEEGLAKSRSGPAGVI